MSDRPGVDAPTEDGAGPQSGSGPADAGPDASDDRPTDVRSGIKDLFAADLFGAGPSDPPAAPSPSRPEAAEPTEAASSGRLRLRELLGGDDRSDQQEDPSLPGWTRGKLRARKVHRIVRRVDPWSVLKFSLMFFFCVWLMAVISGVLIWGVAVGSGTVENLEGFIARLLSFDEFHFNADQIFRLFAMGGLIMVFLATALAAILSVLFNLISDLIGGIRVTVIEEETTRRIVRRP
ncbi:MAG: DUF3566 domain-containing protein [Acidimicrobiia bacterium]|nr:DUF3566 domain-containing protein [Acidimicrobiia bacterium]